MLATLASKPFSDPDWLFEIKWDGYRVQAVVDDGKVRIWTRNLNDAETYFPRLLTPPTWIEAERGHRRRRGRRARRRRAAGLRPPPGAARRQGAPGARLPGVRPALSRRSVAARRPAGGSQAAARERAPGDPRVRYATHSRGRGSRSTRPRKPRRSRGSSPSSAGPATSPAADRTPGSSSRSGRSRSSSSVAGRRGRGTPASSARSSSASTTAIGCGSPARWARGSRRGPARTCERALAALEPERPAVRSGAATGLHGSLGRRPRRRALGPAGAGHPGRDRLAGRATGTSARPPTRGSSRAGTRGRSRASARSTRRRPERDAAGDRGGGDDGRCRRRSCHAKAPATTARPDADIDPRGATDAELAALDAPRQGRHLARRRPRAEAHQPRQAAVPAAGRRGRGRRSPSASSSATSPGSPRRCCPHLADRPLNLQRFPNGAGRPRLLAEGHPDTAPRWLTRWHETGVDGREDRTANDHLIADRAATLCWLGNQASFEIHAWTGRSPRALEAHLRPHRHRPRREDDLGRDPRRSRGSTGPRSSTSASAAIPRRTGKRGIQVWIPVEPAATPSPRRAPGSRSSHGRSGRPCPDLVSWEWAKADRGGKARLDYTQNASIKTLVAPYAVRPRPGAPVSAPITWDELDDPDLRPDRWTIRNVVERVTAIGDLWAGLQDDHQVLPPL